MPNTDYIATHGQMAVLDATIVLTVGGFGTVGFEIGGTFTGTVTFEGRVGGGWRALAVATLAVPGTFVTTATAPGSWVGSAKGLTQVRMRFSTATSGTVLGDITASGV
jgi:hypothetical protein